MKIVPLRRRITLAVLSLLLGTWFCTAIASGTCQGRPIPMVGLRCVTCGQAISISTWYNPEIADCLDPPQSFILCPCPTFISPLARAGYFARFWPGGPWVDPVCCPTTKGYSVEWDADDQCQSIICVYTPPPCTPNELEPCDGDLP